MSVKPLSWSAIWLYDNNPEQFYTQYVLGIKEPPTREMLLGSIIHAGFEGKDWKKELIDNNFTPDYERTVAEIMKFPIPKMTQQEVWLGEKGREYEETDCSLAARADGINDDDNVIIEIKTGKNFWTQERADEHGQLTLYAFLKWKETGKIPGLLLVSCNVNNGKVKVFYTKRTEEQIKEMCNHIKEVVKQLKERGWWENRI